MAKEKKEQPFLPLVADKLEIVYNPGTQRFDLQIQENKTVLFSDMDWGACRSRAIERGEKDMPKPIQDCSRNNLEKEKK